MPVSQPTALDEALTALVRGAQCDPFAILGPHVDEAGGTIVRAFRPAARSIELVLTATNTLVSMERRGSAGVFEARLTDDPDYRLRITYANGEVFEIDDPYRYGRVLTDFDLHLLSEGTHFRAFEKLGARRIAQGPAT